MDWFVPFAGEFIPGGGVPLHAAIIRNVEEKRQGRERTHPILVELPIGEARNRARCGQTDCMGAQDDDVL